MMAKFIGLLLKCRLNTTVKITKLPTTHGTTTMVGLGSNVNIDVNDVTDLPESPFPPPGSHWSRAAACPEQACGSC